MRTNKIPLMQNHSGYFRTILSSAKQIQGTRLGFDIFKDDDSNQNNNMHEQKAETKKVTFTILKTNTSQKHVIG